VDRADDPNEAIVRDFVQETLLTRCNIGNIEINHWLNFTYYAKMTTLSIGVDGAWAKRS